MIYENISHISHISENLTDTRARARTETHPTRAHTQARARAHTRLPRTYTHTAHGGGKSKTMKPRACVGSIVPCRAHQSLCAA